MRKLIEHIAGVIKGKHPASAKRSSHWSSVRAQHLVKQPKCAVCGGAEKLQVHHIHPFHLHPELELDPDNLITLCESGPGKLNCHIIFGHLGNFRSYNPDVEQDATIWAEKFSHRPKG